MRNNDLSNRQAPIIAFRVEDFLLKKKSTGVVDRVRSAVKGNYNSVELNREVVSTINFIFRHTDMSAYLVVDKETKFNIYEKELIDQVHYSHITSVAKPVEITVKLLVGDFSYYIDDDLRRMSEINHNKSITITELNQLIRGY